MTAKSHGADRTHESVLDYPRPPRVEDCGRHIRVELAGEVVAETHRSKRVLETTHPPVYYIPPLDIETEFLIPSQRRTFCEFKGHAHYYSVVVPGRLIPDAAWYYPQPVAAYAEIEGYVAFYPALMDACYVDGEAAQPQPGDFYGGWITSEIDGPFRGG